MKICIFSRAFYPAVGGLERIAEILASQAAGFGHEVEVVTDKLGLSDMDDKQFPFKITRTQEYRHRVHSFKRADVLLFMNVSLHGMIAAIASRRPIIFSHHGIHIGHGVIGRSLEFLKRQLTWLYPNISVSQFVANSIPSISVVIPNAYDNSLFKQPELRTRTRDFVFCGRLVSDKGVDVLLHAFSKVVKSFSDSTLTVIGDGPERLTLMTLAQSLGISRHVSFTGTLNKHELVNKLQQHACMVVPSLCEEAFGIVALEGIACCDAVIVSRRGGLPEAVGKCGYVVDPTVNDISNAMTIIVRARRSGMLLAGQPSEKVRQAHLSLHTPERVTQKYIQIAEQTLSHRNIRRI